MRKYNYFFIILVVVIVVILLIGYRNGRYLTSLDTKEIETAAVVDEKIGREICSVLASSAKYVGDKTIEEGDEVCSVTKVDGNFAKGGVGSSGGGIAWLATKIDNKWAVVQKSQDSWSCEILEQYNFPKGFTKYCFSSETNESRDW